MEHDTQWCGLRAFVWLPETPSVSRVAARRTYALGVSASGQLASSVGLCAKKRQRRWKGWQPPAADRGGNRVRWRTQQTRRWDPDGNRQPPPAEGHIPRWRCRGIGERRRGRTARLCRLGGQGGHAAARRSLVSAFVPGDPHRHMVRKE
eukprot:TRINITY_DN584_c0_g1_i1.p2 TRINITY_DN584_c0_g1~~TRINITY_DN584_c0_g1_i1.p2  ORF type:complete len:149 (-),score=10.87 TRINITY_DN584_c0_g1_i1:352-798(-)